MPKPRPIRRRDLPGLARLLAWMDEDPSRRVLAPEGRTPEALAHEVELGWVLEDEGELLGYVGLVPFWRGVALEGPVSQVHPEPLLRTAIAAARAQGAETLYAFPTEENEALRTALEAQGFGPVHTTTFFLAPARDLGLMPPSGVELREAFDPEAYREVYREADEGWSLRLSWTDEELAEHFAREENRLILAYVGGRPVGMAELELDPPFAELAYLGVVPAHRGRGIGQALLSAALAAAGAAGAQAVRTRAHDHEKEALALFRKLGFEPLEAVVTYAKELAP